MDSVTISLLVIGGAGGVLIGIWVGHSLKNRRAAGNNDTNQALSAMMDSKLESLSALLSKDVNENFLKTSRHLREQSQSDLQQRQQSIADLVQPIRAALDKTERQVQEIEKERKQDQGSLKEKLKQVSRGQQQLQTETARLVSALRKPQVRGNWGEITLRRTVELASMTEYCDFEEQTVSDAADSQLRPDMIVHLPNERRVVVDAKTPLDAYLAAVGTNDENEHEALLQKHAAQVKERIKNLSSKTYWRQFDDTLEFVVMFVPGEQFLAAALDREPNLHEYALRERVILAAPPTLVALLRAIEYGWRQKSLEENAQKIQRLGEELHGRTATFTEHLARIGKNLSGSISAYNDAVGSLERNLLTSVRKFTELGIQQKKEIAETKPVESTVREISALPQPEEESEGKAQD